MMNAEEERECVQITHFINPHMFWFKYESSCLKNTELSSWENELQAHFFKLTRSPMSNYQPRVDEIVAVFIFSMSRWIRAKCDFIDEIDGKKKYSVWAIDYGVPYQLEDRWIRPLPNELEAGPKQSVYFAGLMGVVPAQKTCNVELETKLVNWNKWSPGAIITIDNLIKGAIEIRFVTNRKMKEQFFGKLIFTTKTKQTVMADEILIKMEQAKHVPTSDFFQILNEIRTNKLARWTTPNDDGTPMALKGGVASDNDTTAKKQSNNLDNSSPIKLVPSSVDNVIDVERKCTDWAQQNEKYQMEGDITIDDISFMDSVSVRHLKENEEDNQPKELHQPLLQNVIAAVDNDDDDPPIIMKAGLLRRQHLIKYQDGLPRPPSEKMDSSKNSLTGSSEKDKSECLTEKNNEIKEVLSDTKESDESHNSEKLRITSEGVRPSAVNILKNRLADKRKALQMKRTENTLNSSPDSQKDNTISTQASISNAEKLQHEDTKKSALKETSNKSQASDKHGAENLDNTQKSLTNPSPPQSNDEITKLQQLSLEEKKEPPVDRYSKFQKSRQIPAGFDMRYIDKPKSRQLGGSRKSNSSRHSSGSGSHEPQKQQNQHVSDKSASKESGESRSPSWIPPSNKDNDISDCVETNDPTERKLGYRLKRTYDDANRFNLNSLDEKCLQTNLSKHLVLVHGRHIAKPIDKLANANFCDEVHQELEHMRLTQLYRIQSYTWPHIMRGNSAVIVSSARTGRTMAYLPAICSLVKMESDEGQVPDTVGPIGIIIAPSSLEVERISKLSRRFLQGSPTKLAIVESYGVRNMEKTTRYLLNGCEVLVTTPCSLNRLIKNKLKMFDSKRIKHLIIDNIDFMHEEMQSELHEILRFCCGAKSTTSVQLVVIAKYWNPILSGFIKIGHNTQLCIGAYIEAAVYARSLISMKFIKKKSKAFEVMDFIRDHPYLMERLVIICNQDEEVEVVADALKSNSCFHIACSSRSTSEELELTSKWHDRPAGDMCILICTDDVLPDIKVSNAQNIIHYSLPQSWTRFSFRFSTLFGYVDDSVKSSIPLKTPPAILILLDENNNSQLPKLMHFLQVHNVENIPKEIHALCSKIQIQREEDRISENREFCSYIMEFGKCFNIDDCPYRHELTKYDIPEENLLVSGNIKFKVLSIISPTHYTVRLLEHQAVGSKTWSNVRCSNEYLKFNLKFAQYFSEADNRQMHWPISVGDMCVVSEGETFHRAKVLFVGKSKSVNLITDVTCRVKLVDIGRVIPCKSSRVLFLPEQFQHLPHQAVNLRLSGVVPYDHEQDWSHNAVVTVQHWFETHLTDKVNVISKIKFSLMDMIWVENIKLVSQLETIQTYVTEINIKKALLEKQFGTINNDAEEVLKQKAVACGIFKDGFPAVSNKNTADDINMENSNSKETKKTSSCNGDSICSSASSHALRHKTQLKQNLNDSVQSGRSSRSKRILKQELIKEQSNTDVGQWENLPQNEFCRILIGAFYTPNHFYVQHLHNLDGKEKLYNAIDKFVEENPVIVKDPKIGLNCLAKYDGKYNRAKIAKVLCDGENNELVVSLFFCDIGISDTIQLSQIIHSSKKLVTMLPFQAIRCKLTGIVPKAYGLWTEDICDEIYDNVLDPAQFLFARSFRCEMPHEESDCKYWRCEVVLLDCTTDEDVKLNDKIVEMGYASYDPETQHFLSIVANLPPADSEDDNESTDSNWDNCNYVNPLKLQYNPDNEFDNLDIDVDIQFSQDDILQLLNLPPTAKILSPEQPKKQLSQPLAAIEEAPRANKDKSSAAEETELKKISRYYKNKAVDEVANLASSASSESERIQYKTMPQLKMLYRSPQVVWQQSQSLISLQISAPDVKDYYLKVTSTNLLFIANIENTTKVLALNFCGCIDPKLVSHEVRGLKVLVRLPKTIKGLLWPRLISESDKPYWLKYNYESIIIEKEALLNTGKFGKDAAFVNMSSDTDSFTDDEDFVYNRDDFDPFDDDFTHS